MQQSDTQLDTIRSKVKDTNDKMNNVQFKYIHWVLVRCYKKDNKMITQIVVPDKLKETVLVAAHSIPLAAHMGVNKTFKRISTHFYWFKMGKEIKKYIQACEKCQRYNEYIMILGLNIRHQYSLWI